MTDYTSKDQIYKRINILKDVNLPYIHKHYLEARKAFACATMTRKRTLKDWLSFRDKLNVFIEMTIRKNEYESELRKLRIILSMEDQK